MTAARICAIGDEAGVDLPEQLAAFERCGLNAIELRTIGGRSLDALSFAETADAAAAVRAAGLVVPVVDTPIGGWSTSVREDVDGELRRLRRFAERAREFGCTRLRVMSYPNDGLSAGAWRHAVIERMRRLAEAAERLDVVLLHENCSGWAATVGARAVELIERVGSKRLRVLFDAGNGLEHGYDARAYLDAVLPYVEHVHLKDGVRGDAGAVAWCPPGEGQADLSGCVRTLDRAGYAGWYSVEPHLVHLPHVAGSHADGDALARADALSRCLETLDRVWSYA